jgi:transposase InsO family protein
VQLQLTDEELKAVGDQHAEHPWMGGKKGAANLVHSRLAWLGANGYDKVCAEMDSLIGEELEKRRTVTKAVEPYQPPQATTVGQVWASDIFEIQAWGKRYDVCDFLDVYSQQYLALDATPHAASSEFVLRCFHKACAAAGGHPPTIATKTDRGSCFQGAFTALDATKHEQIPPGCPWFNGESERGHRDARAVIYAELSKMGRPKPGLELAAVQQACDRACFILNERISKPSLGNVTPGEVARGERELVRRANEEYVAGQRAARSTRPYDRRPIRERLAEVLGLAHWSTAELVRFVRLRKRDYEFIKKAGKCGLISGSK